MQQSAQLCHKEVQVDRCAPPLELFVGEHTELLHEIFVKPPVSVGEPFLDGDLGGSQRESLDYFLYNVCAALVAAHRNIVLLLLRFLLLSRSVDFWLRQRKRSVYFWGVVSREP